jgi:hypothetical protein
MGEAILNLQLANGHQQVGGLEAMVGQNLDQLRGEIRPTAEQGSLLVNRCVYFAQASDYCRQLAAGGWSREQIQEYCQRYAQQIQGQVGSINGKQFLEALGAECRPFSEVMEHMRAGESVRLSEAVNWLRVVRTGLDAAGPAQGFARAHSLSEQFGARLEEVAAGALLLERLRNMDNPLDQRAAERIIDAARCWVAYGPNFYMNYTGKQARIEAPRLPTGEVDMQGYKRARHQLAEGYRSQEGMQKWIRDIGDFRARHQIGVLKEVERIRRSNGEKVSDRLSTEPYFINDGWIYYEPNVYNPETKQRVLPEAEGHDYRVYLSTEDGDVMATFEELIAVLGSSPELQRYGFQIKTPDLEGSGDDDVTRVANQSDRIVLYLGKEGAKAALPLLQQYAAEHPQRFSCEGIALGQPLVDQQGRKIPGIVLAGNIHGNPKGVQFIGEPESFNEFQAQVITTTIGQIIREMKDPRITPELRAQYPRLYQAVRELGENAQTSDCIRAILFDSRDGSARPEGEAFLARRLQEVYPQVAKQAGLSPRNFAFLTSEAGEK